MKKVGAVWYVHKSNIDEIIANVKSGNYACDIVVAKEGISEMGWEYDVIRYDTKKHSISFIQTDDFNKNPYPIVKDGMKLNMLNDWSWRVVRGRKTNPQIYHMKEVFVAPSYKGFDLAEAKERTRRMNEIPDLDKTRIRNYDFFMPIARAYGLI